MVRLCGEAAEAAALGEVVRVLADRPLRDVPLIGAQAQRVSGMPPRRPGPPVDLEFDGTEQWRAVDRAGQRGHQLGRHGPYVQAGGLGRHGDVHHRGSATGRKADWAAPASHPVWPEMRSLISVTAGLVPWMGTKTGYGTSFPPRPP